MARLKALASRLGAAPPRLRPPPKTVEPFYSSKAWRSLVAARKLDRDYFAALSRAKAGERLILDHRIERKDGGADLDPANTEWLTMSEHQRKTARARARRARGEGGGSKV
jgi:5-methylcytosine-specific restriction protein A